MDEISHIGLVSEKILYFFHIRGVGLDPFMEYSIIFLKKFLNPSLLVTVVFLPCVTLIYFIFYPIISFNFKNFQNFFLDTNQ